jgi:opacity protein-like surface antigen
MELKFQRKSLNYSKPIIGIMFALASTIGIAGGVEQVMVSPPPPTGKIYVGVFGGIASSSSFDVNQFGTAFYTEANGGPLAVNAFGRFKGRSNGFIGGQVGYQWTELSLSPSWGLVPALELEGYYLGKSTFTGSEVNNITARLPEHLFVVSYPTKTGVFLTNAVLNLDSNCLGRFHPYVGVGFGGSIASISNAIAAQISPPEPGINHFNSNPSDTAATFAAQAKIGLNFSVFKNLGMFVEYRWLALSSTRYAFGSTVYPGHPETSNWQVKMDPRYYNLGAIGIQLST